MITYGIKGMAAYAEHAKISEKKTWRFVLLYMKLWRHHR